MNYELVCILSPKITDKEIEGEANKIGEILTKNGTEGLEVNIWGKKELIYPIKKFTDGYYVQYNFEVIPEQTNKISEKLKLEDKIIRFLIMKNDNIVNDEDVEDVKEEKAKLKKDDVIKEDKHEEIKDEKKDIEVKDKKEESKEDLNKKLDEVLEKELTD